MEYAAACIVGYLLGSIPVSLLVARRHGVDLRATGDGNPGAWNALEQLGWRRAWPAFVGDALKGTLAALCGFALGDIWVAYAAVAAAMVGHAFPLFAGFRGGKSVMTFVGGAIALSPARRRDRAGPAGAAVVLARRLRARRARRRVRVPAARSSHRRRCEQVAATGGLMCLIGLRFLAAGAA